MLIDKIKRLKNENKKIMIISYKKIIKNKEFSFKKKRYLNKKIYSIVFFCLITFIINNILLISIFKTFKFLTSIEDKNSYKAKQNSVIKENQYKGNIKSNVDPKYEFFQIKEVNEQIQKKNLTYIETLSGGAGNVGNVMLNNWINICVKIKCKNIIAPGGGLKDLIKKPIFCKEYNITIFPNAYKSKIKVDIILNSPKLFYFQSKSILKPRLRVIRDELFSNIPKYNSHPNDLYINIRSGDIFVNAINANYAQPSLCFYQKIINENNYENIYIISNGHENPVVDRLLKLYPKIKYLHGPVKYDISVIVNAYNFVMPVSTFPYTLIWLNNNLKNLYIYRDDFFGPRHINYRIHKMQPSQKYKEKMRKWNNTKEQLILMLNENCYNSTFISLYLINIDKNMKNFL